MHWRQRAPFRSRVRDRQSSYTPQLCCVRARALETWFGDLSATTRRLALGRELRTRPVPRERTRPFLARYLESSSSPTTHPSLPLPLPPYPVLACDTLRPHAPRLSPTLAGGPIRRATPCMIIAGGSGARATADTASPHALWPAAARRTAPYSSPPADWDDPWRCVHCWEWQTRSGASEHAFGRRECQKQGTGEESPV